MILDLLPDIVKVSINKLLKACVRMKTYRSMVLDNKRSINKMRYGDNAKYSAKIGLKAQSDSADALESMVARGSRVTMQLGNSHNVPIKCTAYSQYS